MELDEILKYIAIGCCAAIFVIFGITQLVFIEARSTFDQFFPGLLALLIVLIMMFEATT